MRMICVFAALAAIAAAQNSHGGMQAPAEVAKAQQAQELQLIAALPNCGLSCLATAIQASPCSMTDHTCSCQNKTIAAQVGGCVLSSCTVVESLATKNISDTICQKPIRNRQTLVKGSSIGSLAIALLAYAIRIFSKIHLSIQSKVVFTDLWWDDALITITVLAAVPYCSITAIMTHFGHGTDVWTVKPKYLSKILRLTYFGEMLYVLALGLVRISILFTYLRFFAQKQFRRWVFIAMGITVAWTVSFLFVAMFQCIPVQYSWTRWDGLHKGKCLELKHFIWPASLTNILIDLMVIALPMPATWSMKLNMRKKMQVMMMFGVGLFVTLVSILRLQALVAFDDMSNFTWVFVIPGLWSKLEVTGSIFCACMPALRNYIRRFAPTLIGDRSDSTHDGTTGMATSLSGRTSPWLASLDRRVHLQTLRRHSEDLSEQGEGVTCTTDTIAASDMGKSQDTEGYIELKEAKKEALVRERERNMSDSDRSRTEVSQTSSRL